MTTFVALLRGVNLGAHNRLPMARLRELLADLGGTDVRTLLQSGNAVFRHSGDDPAELADRLRSALERECGLRVPCVVREVGDLARVVAANPFADVGFDPARLVVVFLSGAPADDDLAGVDPARYAPDEFRVGEREVYAHCPTGLARSTLPVVLGDRLQRLVATARNWNTVTKLAAMGEV